MVMPFWRFAGGFQTKCAIVTRNISQLVGAKNRECLRTILGFVRRALFGEEQTKNTIIFIAKDLDRFLDG
jgi:hypothetical protein